jgi:hypothetical protein
MSATVKIVCDVCKKTIEETGRIRDIGEDIGGALLALPKGTTHGRVCIQFSEGGLSIQTCSRECTVEAIQTAADAAKARPFVECSSFHIQIQFSPAKS